MSDLKVAIVGAGIGAQHLSAYRQLPGTYRVVCLCDLDEERAIEALHAEGLSQEDVPIVREYESLLSNDKIDIIDICLPPHLHATSTVSALKAGKDVICEKPLASSLNSVDQLIAASEETGKSVYPVFQYRYGHGIATLRAMIEAGLTGKPLIASLETHWDRRSEYYAVPWRGTWEGEQGGAVLCHAIHSHDLLTYVLGPVKSLSAFGATRVNEIETEDCAAISFQLENGTLATSSITLGASANTTRLRFCFEHLTAESDLLPYTPAEGNWTFSARGDRFSQSDIDAFAAQLDKPRSGFVGFLEAVSGTIEQSSTSAVTLAEGRQSIELVTAIYDSIRNRRTVTLPITKQDPMYHGWLADQ